MSDIVPAWSEAFAGDGPGPAPGIALPGRPGRDWVYGDGSGRGVRVAVVDSGVDASHPAVGAVAGYVAVEPDESADDGVRFEPGPHDDLYGHGTACAGIIRALAPEVELVSVRVLGTNLKGSARAFAHGLDWCIEHGVHVVNMSMSTGSDDWAPVFWDLVDQAVHRGIILVSAMNNEPRRTIPSEFAGVFSVACAPGDDRERIWANRASPAAWGAAGIDVTVPWTGGGTITATGNSFAAPVVAGHLARIAGAHPGITPAQAQWLLASVAVNAV